MWSISKGIVLGVLFAVSPSWADAGPQTQGDRGRGTQDREVRFAELLSEAQRRGTIAVIVGLDAAFVPEGRLSSRQEIARQRQDFAEVQERVLQKMSGYRMSSLKRFRSIPFFATEVDAPGLRALIAAPEVRSIERDIIYAATLSDSIPLIGADVVHAVGLTGAGQAVAILDTGVDRNHPFLAGKVVSEACFSTTGSSGTSTTLCPNGEEEQIGPGAAEPPCPISQCSHGTHVAGIAAGDGEGFSGVAREADIIAIQVFSRRDDNDAGTPCADIGKPSPCLLVWGSDSLSGLERVLDLSDSFDIAALNMSFGGGEHSGPCTTFAAKQAAFDNLLSVGIAAVSSSGNDSFTDALGSPACLPGVISVGATTKSDEVRSSSNSAPFLDLLAPGQSIESSVDGGGFDAFSGTSMAAPHVTGAWAVLKEAVPDATVDAVLSVLASTGTLIEDTREGADGRLVPRLDLSAALCGPPPVGDWIVAEDCILFGQASADRNVIVQESVTLTLAHNATLDIDFENHHLRVREEGRVILKPGARVR